MKNYKMRMPVRNYNERKYQITNCKHSYQPLIIANLLSDGRHTEHFSVLKKLFTLMVFTPSSIVEIIIDNVTTARLPRLKTEQFCKFCRQCYETFQICS